MTTLGDIARVDVGYAFRSAQFGPVGAGPRLVRGDNIGHGSLRWSESATWSWPEEIPHSRYELAAGDVVLGMDRPWIASGTKYAVVVEEDLPALLVQRVARLRALPGVPQALLRYVVSGPSYAEYIQTIQTGTSIPHVSAAQIGNFPVPEAGLACGVAIAEVLGALDDKIAANQTIASAADELIREAFGRLADADETILVSDLAMNVRDAAKPPFGGGSYVGLEHVPRRLMFLTDVGEVEGLASGKFQFSRDDVLFGKLRPYFHKVVVADRPGICSTDILVVRPRKAGLCGFVWAALSSDDVVRRVSAMSEGTRMPRTNWADLAACAIAWPGDERARAFSDWVVACRDRVSAGLRESLRLAELRDTLLPHLMSGRLSVRDAEAQVEAVL